jgi:2-haloacid dehalogenase
MAFSRREFVSMAAVSAVSGLLAPARPARAVPPPAIKAIAFDAFAVFDPRPVATLAERLFPGRGRELTDVWRMRQFEYQWLRLAMGRYADFWRTTEDALLFAAEWLKLALTAEARRLLMGAYLELTAWPEVAATLRGLRRAGARLALLSNATLPILNAGIANAGLHGVFEHVLSTDALKTYKPHPRAYRLASRTLRLEVAEILFVPSAGWDAAGAKSFGYRTFWVDRAGLPAERLDAVADVTGSDLAGIAALLRG